MYAVVGVNIKREMVLSQNDEEVANSSKKYTQFKTRLQKPYPISDENGRIDTLFQTKTAQKNISFGAAHTYIVYIRNYPPPPRPPPGTEKRVADYESRSLRKRD